MEKSGENSWRVRFRREDDTIGSIHGFTNATDARNHAADMESDQRRGTWTDPALGKTIVDEWLVDWLDALDVDIRTEENYRGILRNHIQPKWGTWALDAITNLKVQAWAKELRTTGRSPVTVAGFVKLLSLILSDAVDDKLITANPIRPRRRGKKRHTARRPEKVWAEPVELLGVADQTAVIYGPDGATLLTTAGWTGARWGELTGLQRPNLHLFDDDTGYFDIDPDTGALHESAGGKLWLGPPKTEASARKVTLAPFNVRLLRAHLETHNNPFVFCSSNGEPLRRSNFARRALRPAADGNLHLDNPAIRLQPAKLGLTFHGNRHSHKTWMIADNIPEIAQALRLGHILKDKIQQTYSHVAAEVEHTLIQRLQDRWEKAVVNRAGRHDTAWRDTAAT